MISCLQNLFILSGITTSTVVVTAAIASMHRTQENTDTANIHWVPLTTNSVTTSTRLQQVDFVASKSLTVMLKSSVTESILQQRAVFFASICSLQAGPSVSLLGFFCLQIQ